MELSYITKDGLTDLLQSLDEQYSIFLPFRKGNTRFYKSFSNSHQFSGSNGSGPAIGEIRACEHPSPVDDRADGAQAFRLSSSPREFLRSK